jgi:EAL domain-containing protein (putative c-di-GMP-specific phosphodiesterase class I)
LIDRAGLAVDEAQRNGGGLVRHYNAELNRSSARKLELGRELRRAVEREELEIHYQPLVDLPTQRVMGAEALLRWEHRFLGRISPVEFIPLAEEIGLMNTLGGWVLRMACRQLKEWIDMGLPPIRLSINVSQRQLASGDLAETVRAVLEETELDGQLLELELSEQGVLRNEPSILRQLAEIKEMGVRLAVDDFGTGNSAIAYLKRFPLDALKIDQSYVRGVADSKDDAAIASATIAMAHQLELNVIAEGVEDRHQLDFLRGCGCDQYQGFFFSPAVPANEFGRLLDALLADGPRVSA